MKMMKNAVEEKAYENQEAYQRTQMQKDMILERLREQGCRITRQRQLILDIILEEECSCCKEIYYKVQEKDRNIGPATIYRMVNMLEKIGAISRKNMSGGLRNCCRLPWRTTGTWLPTIAKTSPAIMAKSCGYLNF